MIIGKTRFYGAWKSKFSLCFKRRRFNKIISLAELPKGRPARILEVGCSNGMDFIRFTDGINAQIWAADILPCEIGRENVHFVQADAESLPFPDKFFDLVVSVGLLEHIEPMEKLCRVIAEFDRVGRHQVSVVPSAATVLEPHSAELFFPLRIHKNMLSEGSPGEMKQASSLHLNFFTEHTWTKFRGFCGCKVKRFFYIPPFVTNTFIYK